MVAALSKGSLTVKTRGTPITRSAEAGSSKESLSKIVAALALGSKVGGAPAKNPWGVAVRAAAGVVASELPRVFSRTWGAWSRLALARAARAAAG